MIMWKVYLAAGIAVVVALVAFFGWSTIQSTISSISNLSAKVQRLEHQKALDDAKISAYQRAQERRDAAIKASPCKNQIEFWIKNPDNLPGTWNPHEQLTAPNIRDNPKPGGSMSFPNLSWLNPFGWF